MKIALASDHAGWELKEAIKPFLSEHEVTDFGPEKPESMDYPDTGFSAAEAVSRGICDRAIIICGSGIGMSIVANKVKGIRAALCQTVEFARLSRQHNNANALILSGRFISSYLAKEMIDVWLSEKFLAGRHQNRLDKITEYEKSNC